jgi:membrane associated rhomboid family serine protease
MIGIPVLRKEGASHEFIQTAWNSIPKNASESSRSCPHCNNKMLIANPPGNRNNVTIDLCKRCACIYLDPGEYEEIPRKIEEKPPEKRLSPAARKMVALAEVKSISETHDASSRVESPDNLWQYLISLCGLPYECNAPVVRSLPWITWSISAVITTIFIATLAHINTVVDAWGFIASLWYRKAGLTLLTSFFLHAGFFHLIANGYFLLIFGDNVEDLLGKSRYALLLLASHIVGTIITGAVDPRTFVPSVGASAGISGIIAFYAISFPHAKISVLLTFGALFNWIRISVIVYFAFWLFIQFLMSIFQVYGSGDISYIAHLSGALVGVVFALIHRNKKLPKMI